MPAIATLPGAVQQVWPSLFDWTKNAGAAGKVQPAGLQLACADHLAIYSNCASAQAGAAVQQVRPCLSEWTHGASAISRV